MQPLTQQAEDGREVGQRPYLAGQLVNALQRSVECLFIGGRQLIAATGPYEHAQEEIQEIQVLVCRLQRERVDAEAGIFQSDVQIRPAEDPRQRLVTAAEVEDEGERFILLRGLPLRPSSKRSLLSRGA